MTPGLTFRIVDVDPDYLSIVIQASNDRFAGTARVYTDPEQLSDLAERLVGFPASSTDERKFEFGSTDPTAAGGYCALRFYCTDKAGHGRIDITLEDEEQFHEAAVANFSVPVLAADLDRFTVSLREMVHRRTGEATVPAAL